MNNVEPSKEKWLLENAIFGLEEDLRVLKDQVHQLHQHIRGMILLPEEVIKRIKTLDKALAKVRQAKKELKKQAKEPKSTYKRGKYKCQKKIQKKEPQDASPDCGTIPESKPSFLKSWWSWPGA